MRSKIEDNEYKVHILGFIFYKYLSDKLVRFARSKDFSDEVLRIRWILTPMNASW